MKITWCNDRLAIADIQDYEAVVDAFLESGITHVLSCRRRNPASFQILHGIVVFINPTEDDGLPKAPEWFGKSIHFALGALALPRNRVCVCCCNGNNRAPSTALAILMAQGLAFDVALDIILATRSGAEIRYRQDARTAVKLLGYCR